MHQAGAVDLHGCYRLHAVAEAKGLQTERAPTGSSCFGASSPLCGARRRVHAQLGMSRATPQDSGRSSALAPPSMASCCAPSLPGAPGTLPGSWGTRHEALEGDANADTRRSRRRSSRRRRTSLRRGVSSVKQSSRAPGQSAAAMPSVRSSRHRLPPVHVSCRRGPQGSRAASGYKGGQTEAIAAADSAGVQVLCGGVPGSHGSPQPHGMPTPSPHHASPAPWQALPYC